MSAKKKTSAARPGPINYSTDIYRVALADITDIPDLSAVPTLEQAAAMAGAEDDEGPARDWAALCGSVEVYGLLEPLKCVRDGVRDGERWLCADGRSRRAAAAILLASGKEQFKTVPVMEIDAAQVQNIVQETLNRRNVPAFVACYLRCLEFEEQLVSRRRGRPVREIAADDMVTQGILADRCHVSRTTVIACVAALRFFKDHPADRERDEPRILAGLLSPERVACGAGGREATAGKSRKPSDYASWLPKLKSFTSTARDFHRWKLADVENATRALVEAVREWPRLLREAVAETCAATTEPSPSESAAKKKGPKA